MTDRIDAVVIGAGIVGLACARALARAGKETTELHHFFVRGPVVRALKCRFEESEAHHRKTHHAEHRPAQNLSVQTG